MGFGAGDPDLYRYVGNSPINGSDPAGKIVRLYFNPQFAWLGHIDVVVYDPKTRRAVVYTGAGAGSVHLSSAQPGYYTGENELKPERHPTLPLPWMNYDGHAYIDQDGARLDGDGNPFPKARQRIWNPGATPADDPEAYAPYLGGAIPGVPLNHHTFKAIGVNTGLTFEAEVDKLDKAYKKLKQVPWYNPRVGPNSNTYAHQLLKLAGMDYPAFRLIGPIATGWYYEGRFGYGGEFFDQAGQPNPAWFDYLDQLQKWKKNALRSVIDGDPGKRTLSGE
jgi:hypothetical protein